MFQSLITQGRDDSKDMLQKVSCVTLDVEHLSYQPPPSLLNQLREKIITNGVGPKVLHDRMNSKLASSIDADLIDVSFRAMPGKFTAIISQDPAERKTLMELVAGRRTYGKFDGEVTLLESSSLRSTLKTDNATAYIPREAVSLYMPGLSYVEMITYAARLRMIGSTVPSRSVEGVISHRVNEVLEMMGLMWCKDRIITDRPTSRGSLGGELRKVAIACEIINYAPVLVFDDITSDLDENISNEVVACLLVLSLKGHTVVASFQSPRMELFDMFHAVVVVANGRSIYSSSVDNIYPFFCQHSKFKYTLPTETATSDVGKFLLDIASGTERPHGDRIAPEIIELQKSFESSIYAEKSIGSDSVWDTYKMISLLPEEGISYFDVLCDFEVGRICQQSIVQFKRALYIKFRETEIMKKLFSASIVMALIFGYIVFDMTADFDYTMSLFGFPYTEVMTLTGCLYVFHVIPFGMQVLNAHIFHQKMNVFLFERRGKWVSTFGYFFSSLIPEILFSLFYCVIYSNIVYWMASLNEGWEAYKFYMGIMLLVGAMGTATTLLATAFFRSEIAVRNFYVFVMSTTVMLSGMMFTFPYMRPIFKMCATINPFRWTFPSLMVWMYKRYPDGDAYLHTFEFQGFDKTRIWTILGWVFLADCIAYIYLILPERNTLQRNVNREEAGDGTNGRESFMSIDSDMDDGLSSQRSMNTDLSRSSSGLLRPEYLSRESSVSAKQVLNKKTSSFGNDMDSEHRGPNVSFVDLAYRVPDRSSPLGRREVLHKMSGRFEWGKLSVIMGAEGAGKSSLLHIIGGQKLSSGAEISGKVYYNDRNFDEGRVKAWQRCAFVEALDHHFRDLTVNQAVRYALELRNEDPDMTRDTFEQMIEQVFTLLQLTDQKGTKVKYLSEGQTRRLSIAEELVVGPMVVLLDEPITGLDARESSIIITQTLREIVNQDRTVVCTMHEPSAAVFEVFDTLVLMSKGRLVYMGPADKAVNFFISSPSLGVSNSNHRNPAEFLFDISGGSVISNIGNTKINSETLERHYLDSAAFGYYSGMETFRSTDNTGAENEDSALLLPSGSSGGGDEWRCASFDGAAPDSFVRRSMKYSKASEQPSYQDLLFLEYFVPLLSFFYDLGHIDFVTNARKSSTLLRRALRILFQRPRMIIVSTMTHIVSALVLVYISIDGQENNAAVLTPVAAFGGFLLMMNNIHFAYFLFNNQKVFLREHSRGLYSTFLRWLVEPLPLLLLRSFQAFIWASIIHFGLNLQGGDNGIYYFLMTWLMCLACTMMIETIAYTLKDIRDVYGGILGTALVLFLFSGLFFKASTLPRWMAPWLPSISIIRWYSQGIVNNEFDDNLRAFPTIPLPTGDISFYDMYLSLFGWGGKSKWYSFNCVVANVCGFRLLQLLVCWKSTVAQRGKRCLLKKENSIDKIY